MPETTRHLHLPNGLHVTLRHAPHLTRAAAAIRVRAGSHDAPGRWPGLAHFLEHLLFLGTARFPLDNGLMRFVQGVGGQVNASTRERTTDFFFEVPPAAFAGALERLCQMLAEPDLGADRQSAEREVIHAEFIGWSRDAQAQRQFALLQAVSPAHPLRGFHAGNRYTLTVPSPAFQNALQQFHQQFYCGAQMTLSLCGPQSLDALQTMAERLGSLLAKGPLIVQTPAPPLLESSQRAAAEVENGLLFAHEHLPQGAEPALALLFHYLTDPSPGGWLAEMQRRHWLQGAKAQTLYSFAGQVLWHLELNASVPAMTDGLQAALRNWFGWLRDVDVNQLNAQFSAAQRRKGLTASALHWARSDSSGQPFEGLDGQGFAALGQLLDDLSGEGRQAFSPEPSLHHAPASKPVVTDDPAEHWATPERAPAYSELPCDPHERGHAPTAPWHLPEPEPLLLDSLPPAAGLPMTEALHIDPTLPSHRQFACWRLRWHLPGPEPTLECVLREALSALQARAEQAGVTLRFDSLGSR
ncbi:pyrroloquinoline quinone biosynthesis protein PqqF, partial [Pseudomonas sp.]|uniref:pyrroloquinoline quinone biosynthesis protein PqqF n=1 Tax=Pseudomonas sp. TaxID=306 RepID=UPI0028AA27CE